MVYNPHKQNAQQAAAPAPAKNSLSQIDRNDYSNGLVEDNEVKFLYFRDRKTFVPANIEPPEEFFDEQANNFNRSEAYNGISPEDDDFVPSFDEPPLDVYLNDAPSLSDLDGANVWDSVPSEEHPAFENNAQQDEVHANNVAEQEIPEQTNQEIKTNNQNNEEKKVSKYDYVKLESIPLDFLALHVGGDPIDGDSKRFTYKNQKFKLDGQRWYNETFKHGDEGAISLCKELMAIYDQVDVRKFSRVLGGKACKYLEGAFADYVSHYKKEPPVFEKKKNYQQPNAANNSNTIVRPTLDDPYTFIATPYMKLTKEEISTYFTVLDFVYFDVAAKLLGLEKDSENEYICTSKTGKKLYITVDGRVSKVQQGRKEKVAIGSLSFTGLCLAHLNDEDFFVKETGKKYRSEAAKFLSARIQEQDLNKEELAIETMEFDKTDPSYLFKMPYHRLSEEEKVKYYEILDNQPLEAVASMLGATDFEDGQAGKWKFRESFMVDNIQISADINSWNSWNSEGGGFGALSLIAFYYACRDGAEWNKDTKTKYRTEAAKFLSQQMDSDSLSYDAKKGAGLKSEVFTMPHILEPKNPHVKEYLTEKRGLPKWVVQKQMNAGYLFAGYPAHWREHPKLKVPEFMPLDSVWAVFLTVSGQGAEMRGIARSDHQAKILAKGSDKHLGGFLTKAETKYNEKTVCSFEAAIDSLSYHAIYPGRITQSCMGTEFKLAAAAAADTLLYTGTKHSCCFDNDYAGIKASVKYFEMLQELMRDEDEYDKMMEKKKDNPDYKVPDEILYKDFIAAVKNDRIGMFELTIKDFEESLKRNELFYLDILEDKYGMTAAKLFYKAASKTLGKNVVDEAYRTGQFKYMNVLPSLRNMELNLNETVKITLDKLLSNKNYYLEMPDVQSLLEKEDDFNNKNEDEQKEEIKRSKIILANFYKAFEEAAAPHLEKLKADGNVVYERKTFFKDWNEHLIYMKKTYPEFAQLMEDREKEFAHYSQPDAPKIKPLTHNK